MYNEFATYTKDEDILLMEEELTPPDDVEMLSAEELEKHRQSFSSVNRRDNIVKVDDSFVLWKKFVDIDTSETTDEAIRICNCSIAETSSMEPKQKVLKTPKSRGTYRQYTCGQQKSYLT